MSDWGKWQITRNFFFDDQLRYDELSPLSRVLRTKDKSECEQLLGTRPLKRVGPSWKSTEALIAGATKGMPKDYEKRWHRLLFEYPSNYFHIRHAEEPTPAYVIGSSQLSVLVTMQVAMEICRDRKLGSGQTIQAANDIVARCKSLREQ